MQETKLLYLDDAYSTKCEGKVIFNEFTDLVVDQTVFFPPPATGSPMTGGARL
ncbi:hypothetical protein [Thermogymnomonas acidicola]|uniref:hypothetical protein n=1 Tax=Thermogymnomonas acidicola TaxID=399579 RepID=UPI001494F726|nr:hypothetical protein [Thermogymnomonas acidicola]